jgi:AraC-like DNA-binding protein
MSHAPTGFVRAQWSFDLALVCQRFVGGVLAPEPEELIRAVDDLRNGLPVPDSQIERLVLRDRLRIATENAARQFHDQFHRHISRECAYAQPTMRRALPWDDFDCSPSQLLAQWVTGYLEEFAGSHGWPPPMRAARVIRGSFEKPLDVDRIARAVGCARSGLIRSFKDVYGMSMGDYQTRCRVRSAFGMLRASESNVGAAAFQAGYQSTKNFYRVLRELTGMTPSQVRELRDEDAQRILDNRLQLPAGTFTLRLAT